MSNKVAPVPTKSAEKQDSPNEELRAEKNPSPGENEEASVDEEQTWKKRQKKRREDSEQLSNFGLFLSHCRRKSQPPRPDTDRRKRELVDFLGSDEGKNHVYWADWLDLDRDVNDDWWNVIETAIDQANTIICFITEPYLGSFYCLQEVAFAKHTGRFLIVVMLEDEARSILDRLDRVDLMWDRSNFKDQEGTPWVGEEKFSKKSVDAVYNALKKPNWIFSTKSMWKQDPKGIKDNLLEFVLADVEHRKMHSSIHLQAKKWENAGMPSVQGSKIPKIHKGKNFDTLLTKRQVDQAVEWRESAMIFDTQNPDKKKNPIISELHFKYIRESQDYQKYLEHNKRVRLRRLVLLFVFLSGGLLAAIVLAVQNLFRAIEATDLANERLEQTKLQLHVSQMVASRTNPRDMSISLSHTEFLVDAYNNETIRNVAGDDVLADAQTEVLKTIIETQQIGIPYGYLEHDPVVAQAVSPDGQHMVTIRGNGIMQFYDLQIVETTAIHNVTIQPEWLTTSFSVIYPSRGWDWQAEFNGNMGQRFCSIKWAPNGSFLVFQVHNDVLVWEVGADLTSIASPIATLNHNVYIRQVLISPDSRFLGLADGPLLMVMRYNEPGSNGVHVYDMKAVMRDKTFPSAYFFSPSAEFRYNTAVNPFYHTPFFNFVLHPAPDKHDHLALVHNIIEEVKDGSWFKASLKIRIVDLDNITAQPDDFNTTIGYRFSHRVPDTGTIRVSQYKLFVYADSQVVAWDFNASISSKTISDVSAFDISPDGNQMVIVQGQQIHVYKLLLSSYKYYSNYLTFGWNIPIKTVGLATWRMYYVQCSPHPRSTRFYTIQDEDGRIVAYELDGENYLGTEIGKFENVHLLFKDWSPSGHIIISRTVNGGNFNFVQDSSYATFVFDVDRISSTSSPLLIDTEMMYPSVDTANVLSSPPTKHTDISYILHQQQAELFILAEVDDRAVSVFSFNGQTYFNASSSNGMFFQSLFWQSDSVIMGFLHRNKWYSTFDTYQVTIQLNGIEQPDMILEEDKSFGNGTARTCSISPFVINDIRLVSCHSFGEEGHFIGFSDYGDKSVNTEILFKADFESWKAEIVSNDNAKYSGIAMNVFSQTTPVWFGNEDFGHYIVVIGSHTSPQDLQYLYLCIWYIDPQGGAAPVTYVDLSGLVAMDSLTTTLGVIWEYGTKLASFVSPIDDQGMFKIAFTFRAAPLVYSFAIKGKGIIEQSAPFAVLRANTANDEIYLKDMAWSNDGNFLVGVFDDGSSSWFDFSNPGTVSKCQDGWNDMTMRDFPIPRDSMQATGVSFTAAGVVAVVLASYDKMEISIQPLEPNDRLLNVVKHRQGQRGAGPFRPSFSTKIGGENC